MNSPAPKIALVTGASSGIGLAASLALADSGFVTYATARRPEAVTELQSRGLRSLLLDVTDEASMVTAVQEIEARNGAIDLLVNNAGYSELGPVEEIPLDRIRRQFETNVFGLIRLCQRVIPGMRRRHRGRIINISSMGGEFTTPFSGIYHASKYAVEAVSDALRSELQPFGIDVIVIQPAVVRSPQPEGNQAKPPFQVEAASPYAAPMARFGQFLAQNLSEGDANAITPADVGAVILRSALAEHPETRYRVGREADELIALRRRLSDREWDAIYQPLFRPEDDSA